MNRLAQCGAWALSAALLLCPAMLRAQSGSGPGAPAPGPGCSCGAHPPGTPPQRTVDPYAGTPPDLQPYSHFAKPYYENYTQTTSTPAPAA